MDLKKLRYIQTVNRINNNNGARDYYIEEMANDFEDNYSKVIDSFEVEIQTSRATEGFINGNILPTKVLIELENAKTSTESKYYAKIKCSTGLLNTGDYFAYTDVASGRKQTLIMSSIPERKNNYDKHDVIYALNCNQTINRFDFKEPIPCSADNSSYGVKGQVDVMNFSIQDGKMKILMQRNKLTDTFRQNERVVFDHDRNSVYEIIDLSSVTTPGMRRLILDKTEYKEGFDDLVNNIAWNRFMEEGTETVEFEIKSSSNKFEILKSSSVVFKIEPKIMPILEDYKFDWEISIEGSEDGWCEIVENTNDSVTIKNVKGYNKNPMEVVFTAKDEEGTQIRQEVRLRNY